MKIRNKFHLVRISGRNFFAFCRICIGKREEVFYFFKTILLKIRNKFHLLGISETIFFKLAIATSQIPPYLFFIPLPPYLFFIPLLQNRKYFRGLGGLVTLPYLRTALSHLERSLTLRPFRGSFGNKIYYTLTSGPKRLL